MFCVETVLRRARVDGLVTTGCPDFERGGGFLPFRKEPHDRQRVLGREVDLDHARARGSRVRAEANLGFEDRAIWQHHGREPHDVRLALQGPQDQRVVHVAVRNTLPTRDVREARLSRRRVERFRWPPLRRTYDGGSSHRNHNSGAGGQG